MRPNIDTHQGDDPVPRARNGAPGTWHAASGPRARGDR
jgi:hypothetical protein